MKKLNTIFYNSRRLGAGVALLMGAMFMNDAAQAQVQFELEWSAEKSKYQVSMISDATYEAPYNITSTAQVTIKAPTGEFDVYNLTSLQNDVEWEANAHFVAPAEAPKSDYISFGLKNLGTKGLTYEAGVKVPLFTFENAEGCTGAISLVDNHADAFLPPNTRKANIANQLTVLGAEGNAYVGNVSNNPVDCAIQTTTTSEIEAAVAGLKLYPTPTKDILTVELNWTLGSEDINYNIYDIRGQLVLKQTASLTKGLNKQQLSLSDLKSGTYTVELQGKDWAKTLQNFVKL